MRNNEKIDIRWEVEDPQGRQVILKLSTYEEHLIGDHETRDAKIREETEHNAKQAIISPDIIIEDDALRHLYYNAIAISENEQSHKIKILKVIVDSDRTPNEVVSWIPLRKGDKVGGGAIIYERGKDGLSN